MTEPVDPERWKLLCHVRYAERLAARTARLYRNGQTAATFLTTLGASSAFLALTNKVPSWISVAGAALLAVVGSATLAVRPHEKAVANDQDARRFVKLRTAAEDMDAAQLRRALNEAQEGNAPEVESLRAVTWNEVADEVGSVQPRFTLSWFQRLLAAFA